MSTPPFRGSGIRTPRTIAVERNRFGPYPRLDVEEGAPRSKQTMETYNDRAQQVGFGETAPVSPPLPFVLK